MRQRCLLCGSDALAPLLDIGPQPIANRFLRSADEPEERYPIALLQCGVCGLVQIDTPVPARALIPPFDWVTYNEPEAHLDALVETLLSLPGVGSGATAAGVSFKDDTTLARLAHHGLRTWRLDLREDLRVAGAHGGHGVETIQDRLTPDLAREVVSRRGPADVLLVRHIVEHAARPHEFMEALKILTSPDGYVVVEVPDCSRAMDACDYTTIWEEHTLYFTPATFGHGFRAAGFDVVRSDNFPYPFENSLVAIAKANGHGGQTANRDAAIARERDRGTAFGRNLPQYRDKVQRRLREHRRAAGPIALFGAGHLACTWVSVCGVADAIDCVVDDNPNKRGLFMPGSRLPIVGSAALAERRISLCLLSLNPIGQEKVIANNAAFIERGGTFASIFPASARALPL